MITSAIPKRSIVIAGHKTSISLEAWAWRHFKRVAVTRGMTYSALAGAINQRRPSDLNLSAAIRRVVVEDLEDALAELLGTDADACDLLVGRGPRLLPAPIRAARAPSPRPSGGERVGVRGEAS